MIITYPVPEHLALRKIPSQVRTKRLINKLWDTTLMLMQKQAVATISTNLVAEAAAVDIASLYRFFPNKESLIYGAIGRSLTANVDALEALAPEDQQLAPHRIFYTLTDIFMGRAESRAVYWSLCELANQDKDFKRLFDWYRQIVMGWMQDQMRYYGCVWTDQAMYSLASYLFSTLISWNLTMLQQAGREYKLLIEWQAWTFEHFLDLAVHKKDPPTSLKDN